MSAYTATPTITSTSYTTAASVTATYASSGRWSVYNPSASIALYASVDGVQDVASVPPLQSWIVDAPEKSAQLWIRLGSAGSVVPTCTLELGFDATTAVSAGASYKSAADFPLVIAAQSTFTPIAPAVGNAWALDSDSINVTLSSASTGALVVGGVSTYRYAISGFAVLSKTGATVATKIAAFIDGVQHTGAGDGSTTDISTRASTIVLPQTLHTIAPGSVVDIRVANMDNADDYTCISATLAIIPCGPA